MPEFIMLIGIPASGKSTYVKQFLEQNPEWTVVSSDVIREQISGDAQCQDDTPAIFASALTEIKKQLKLKKNVIYDATNISYKHRKNILQQIAKLSSKKIACVIATEYEMCLHKNEIRSRYVPETEIEKMLLNFQFPMKDEGFDEIRMVHLYENKRVLSKDVSDMEETDTKNVYHTQTIGAHAQFTLDKFEERMPALSQGYRIGTLLHDIGKFYMMQRVGGPLEHYMGHGSMGAYYLMCLEEQVKQFYSLTDEEVQEMLFLVNYHMQPFIWSKSAGENKAKTADKERFGEERMNLLSVFHECDMLRPGKEDS